MTKVKAKICAPYQVIQITQMAQHIRARAKEQDAVAFERDVTTLRHMISVNVAHYRKQLND